MTNFEKIKAMSVEEMAMALSKLVSEMETCNTCPAYYLPDEVCMTCEKGMKVWLELEVQEDD